ncbi:MAG: urea carboxylase-associated family protein [Rhodospirillaceae bacterium]|nr:urea carboxylase-associated family protein [Rhodospirillaceae bacterium]
MTIDVDLNGKKSLALAPVANIEIPAKGHWAGMLKAGQFIRITDPCGKQAADFWAFNAADLDEHLSAAHTRVWVNRLCPLPGESFHSNRRRPMLQLIADTCGVHDLLTPACDEHRYRLYGAPPGHPSCAGNLQLAVARWFEGRAFAAPQSVNLFMYCPVGADGSVVNGPNPSKPGDHLILKAWMDCLIAISACPQEFNNAAGWYPTEIQVDILEPAPAPAPG